MAYSINEFISSFNTELARPDKFDVEIIMPGGMQQYFADGSQILSLRCEKAQLPSRTFLTAEQKIYGPVEKYPYMSTYNDLQLEFVVSGNMYEKAFFDGWMEWINPLNTHNYQYKDQYTGLITVKQYDLQNNTTMQVGFIDAYPIAVNQLDLDWSQTNAQHKLIVVFAYTYWVNNTQSNFDIDRDLMDINANPGPGTGIDTVSVVVPLTVASFGNEIPAQAAVTQSAPIPSILVSGS